MIKLRTLTNAMDVKDHRHLSLKSATLNPVPAGVTGNHGPSVQTNAERMSELVSAIISVMMTVYPRVKVRNRKLTPTGARFPNWRILAEFSISSNKLL